MNSGPNYRKAACEIPIRPFADASRHAVQELRTNRDPFGSDPIDPD